MRVKTDDRPQPLLSICLAAVFLCCHLDLDNNSAMIQLMAGGGAAPIGTTSIPLLSDLFG
jgi:hypothetical protein